jgi:23S rRNA pseudouridine955/2504/2580 synthase
MSGVQHIPVGPEASDLRLDRWFRERFPALTHGRLEKLLRTGQIRVDGGRVKAAFRLAAGMTIRVPPLSDTPPDETRSAPTHRPTSERDAATLRDAILFMDEDVIALNKPAGLAVQGGTRTNRHLDGMLDALRFDAIERPRLVHRLDKETSGVLLLGRSARSAARLAEAFREKTARKVYWALVAGVPKPKRGRIDLPVSKDGEERAAASYYAVVEQAAQTASWLALMPITGRTHQLRLHTAALGTPILGDGKHGGEKAEAMGGGQLHLHARSISLSGRNNATLRVTAPLPPHMSASWDLYGFAAEPDGDPFADLALD